MRELLPMNNLPQTIESILFATADEYTIAALAKLLNVSNEEVETALASLTASLADHAIMLVRQGGYGHACYTS